MSKLVYLTLFGLALANPVRRMHYHVIDGVTDSSGYGNHPLPQPLEPKQHEPIVTDENDNNTICKNIMIRSIYPNIVMRVNDELFQPDVYYSVNKMFKHSDILEILQNETVLENYTRQDVFNMMNSPDYNNFDDFVEFYFDDCK